MTWLVIFIIFIMILIIVRIKKMIIFSPFATVILIVNNKEECVEGILRDLYRIQKNMPEFELIVLEKLSQDQTPLILRKLSTEFNFKYYEIKQNDLNPLALGILHSSSNVICYSEIDECTEARKVTWSIYKELQGFRFNNKAEQQIIKKIEE